MIKILDKDTGFEMYKFTSFMEAARYFDAPYQNIYDAWKNGFIFRKRYKVERVEKVKKTKEQVCREKKEEMTQVQDFRFCKIGQVDSVLRYNAKGELMNTMSLDYYKKMTTII